ncbi:MAG: hypothetical protein JXR97_14115 [Planctomycetes bacterium]|nr:hypothetical protein [Planctomycetota bacterium]
MRVRTVVFVVAVLVALLAVFYGILNHILIGSFVGFEQESVRADMIRVQNYLSLYEERVDCFAKMLAGYEKTYRFAADGEGDYEKGYLTRSLLQENGIDMVCILDGSGRVLCSRLYGYRTGRDSKLPDNFLAAVGEGSILLRKNSGMRPVRGILGLDTPMIIAAYPVHYPGAAADVHATLIAGSYLGDNEVRLIGRKMRVDLMIRGARELASGSGEVEVWSPDEETLAASAILDDVFGRPVAELVVSWPRELVRRGSLSVKYLLVAIALAGACVGFLMTMFIQGQVLARFAKLRKELSAIRQSKAPGGRVTVEGEDEFTVLSLNINETLAALERLEQGIQQAQRMQALGTLAAGVAHEINNPLNVLGLTVGNLKAKLAGGGADMGEVAGKLEKIEGQIKTIAGIVRHMRELARSENVEPEAVELCGVVGKVIALLRTRAESEGVAVEFSNPGREIRVRAVDGRLEQAIMNIVSNSIDAIVEKGGEGGRVRLSIDESAARARLVISDNGPGLPAERERIFDPFFSTKEVGAGMGLGLSVVHSYVSEWGGNVSAENNDDGGAVFTVELEKA